METVRNFRNYVIFVDCEDGEDRLLHISDLSWTKKVKNPAECTQIRADINVVVIEIEKENRRLSLGHKQLEDNPWETFETIFTVNSVHEGVISEIIDKGAIISLDYDVEGFCPIRGLKKQDGSMPKIQEKLSFKVIEFSKQSKKIILSHTRIFEEEAKDAENKGMESTKQAVRKMQTSIEKTTLGDISDLAGLKEKMNKKDNK